MVYNAGETASELLKVLGDSWQGWALWAVRTLLSIALLGGVVWVIGDRLLLHAMNGYEKAIDVVREDLQNNKQAIEQIDDELADKFLESIRNSDAIKVSFELRNGTIEKNLETTTQSIASLAMTMQSIETTIADLASQMKIARAEQASLRELIENQGD